MTNWTLCITTLLSIAMHFYAFEETNAPLYIVAAYYICLYSSLVNHAFSIKFLQWFDRSSVAMCAVFDIYLIYKMKSIFAGGLLVSAVISYFLAKMYKKTFYHIVAHGLITYAHICLLENVSR